MLLINILEVLGFLNIEIVKCFKLFLFFKIVRKNIIVSCVFILVVKFICKIIYLEKCLMMEFF